MRRRLRRRARVLIAAAALPALAITPFELSGIEQMLPPLSALQPALCVLFGIGLIIWRRRAGV